MLGFGSGYIKSTNAARMCPEMSIYDKLHNATPNPEDILFASL